MHNGYLYSFSSNTDSLLFNFNLTNGDTLKTGIFYAFFNQNPIDTFHINRFVVNKIDSVYYLGAFHKRYSAKLNQVIEGLGSPFGFLFDGYTGYING